MKKNLAEINLRKNGDVILTFAGLKFPVLFGKSDEVRKALVLKNLWNKLGYEENIYEKIAISYSDEGRDFGGALETAGGIVRALSLLGDVFWVAAGDVFAPGFAFTQASVDRFVASSRLALSGWCPTPRTTPRAISASRRMASALNTADQKYTFSTIGLYRAALFAPPYCDIPNGNPARRKAPLAPILRAAMDNELVSAELYTGPWTDVGTPERLAQLNTPTR